MSRRIAALLRPWLTENEAAFLVGHAANGEPNLVARVAIGNEHTVEVPLTEFIGPALALGLRHVTLAHSHPNGSLAISEPDKALTRAVLDACHAVGLTLVDHVIVTPQSYVSLVEAGILGAAQEAAPRAANKH